MRTPLLLIPTILSMGCRPPEAPSTLDDLSSFLFEHTWDEEADYLEVGAENLTLWLVDNMEATNDGYEVTNLSAEAVATLEGEMRNVDGLIGAAVAYDIEHPPVDVIRAMAYHDPLDMYPDTYEYYDRSYIQGEDCFHDRDCDRIDYEVHSLAYLPLGIEVTANFRTQYHWVDMEHGLGAVQRTWTRSPPEINKSWLSLEQEYFLAVTIPLEGGRSRRVESMWVIAELSNMDVPEGMALSMTIDAMKQTQEHLNNYLGGE